MVTNVTGENILWFVLTQPWNAKKVDNKRNSSPYPSFCVFLFYSVNNSQKLTLTYLTQIIISCIVHNNGYIYHATVTTGLHRRFQHCKLHASVRRRIQRHSINVFYALKYSDLMLIYPKVRHKIIWATDSIKKIFFTWYRSKVFAPFERKIILV